MSRTRLKLNNDINEGEYQFLSGIDTLYFFININDKKLYQKVYTNVNQDNDYLSSNLIGYLCKTNFSNGVLGHKFIIYKDNLPVCHFILKNPDTQENIPNLFIQLIGNGIYSMGIIECVTYTLDILNSLFGTSTNLQDTILSRVDINCFINGFDFSKVDKYCFHNPYLRYHSHIIGNDRTETLYLGSRSSDISFKIYNKKLELTKTESVSNSIKIAYLKQNGFDFDKDIWNAEFSLKSNFLKQCSISNIASLLVNFNYLYRYVFDLMYFFGLDSLKYRKYKENSNLCRLENHPIWDMVINQYQETYILYVGNVDGLDSSLKMGSIERVIPKAKDVSLEYYIMQTKKLKAKALGYGISSSEFDYLVNM